MIAVIEEVKGSVLRLKLAFPHPEIRRNQQRIIRITGEWPEVYRNPMKNVLPKGRRF